MRLKMTKGHFLSSEFARSLNFEWFDGRTDRLRKRLHLHFNIRPSKSSSGRMQNTVGQTIRDAYERCRLAELAFYVHALSTLQCLVNWDRLRTARGRQQPEIATETQSECLSWGKKKAARLCVPKGTEKDCKCGGN